MVQHVSDLWQWISRPFTVHDLIADMPLPDHVSPRSLMPVLDRARREIDDMLDDAGFPPTGYRPAVVPDQVPSGKHTGMFSTPLH